MASFIIGFLITVCCVELSIQSTPYLQCKTADGPPPLDLRIEGCSELPCLLRRGVNVNAQWDFTVASNTKKLTPVVKATVLGITITYPFEQENACDTLTNAECPLDEGEDVTYALSLPILSSYPKISLTIAFALNDDSGKPQVCYRLPAKVID